MPQRQRPSWKKLAQRSNSSKSTASDPFRRIIVPLANGQRDDWHIGPLFIVPVAFHRARGFSSCPWLFIVPVAFHRARGFSSRPVAIGFGRDSVSSCRVLPCVSLSSPKSVPDFFWRVCALTARVVTPSHRPSGVTCVPSFCATRSLLICKSRRVA
jgi:hypothetical protein